MTDEFDEQLAASFVGKHLLVGITYVDAAGRPVEQRQVHGHVLRIDPGEGVIVALHGSGEELKLPPDLRSFKLARPGEYRLRSTGEVVVDPDLTCTWVVERPAH